MKCNRSLGYSSCTSLIKKSLTEELNKRKLLFNIVLVHLNGNTLTPCIIGKCNNYLQADVAAYTFESIKMIDELQSVHLIDFVDCNIKVYVYFCTPSYVLCSI